MTLSKKAVEVRAGTFAFKAIRRWLSRKDLVASERIGERLGRIAFRLGKSRRRRALSNLALALPELSAQERMGIAKGVFEHFGRLMCDFVRTESRSPEEVLSSMSIDEFDAIEDMFPPGVPMIFVTGHFGNWERIANYLTLKGYGLSVVVRDANDDELNDMVVNIRRAAGLEVIPRGAAARAVLTKLKHRELVAMLPDQNSDEVFLPFFGKPCGTVMGPAVLAQRAGVPLAIAFCYRSGPGKFRLRLKEMLDPKEHPDLSAEDMMAHFNAQLESMVREFPDQYLWIHDRWKAARTRGLI